MSKQKSGFIVFTVGWIIALVGTIVSLFVSSVGIAGLVAIVLEIVGLAIACKENKGFKNALICLIIELVATIVAVVLTVVASVIIANATGSGSSSSVPAAATTLVRVASIITIVATALEGVIAIYVVQGCGEASEKVKGMAKFLEIFICVVVVLIAVARIVSLYNEGIATVFALVASIGTIVYQVLIAVILLRTIPKLS